MKTTDFSRPRRMSKSAYVVFFVKDLCSYAGFIFLAVIFNLNAVERSPLLTIFERILIAAAGCIVLAAATSFVRYYFRKYYVENGSLIFIHGLFHKETTSIPLEKIHTLRTRRDFIYRLMDMRSVSFDTLAMKSAEIEMILDDTDWNALLSLVETQEQKPEDKERETGKADADKLVFSNMNLIKGAFCQNHLQGMVVLFGILAAILDRITAVNDNALDFLIGYADACTRGLSVPAIMYIAVLIALYMVIMLLWIGKAFLRYANMEVKLDREQLAFESGLITRKSSRFPYGKICTVYVKRNFLEKLTGCSTIRMIQAENATDEQKGTDVRIYGTDRSGTFLDWWLGKDYASSGTVLSAQSGYGMTVHVMRFDIPVILAAAAVLAYFGLYVWLAAPAAYLAFSLAKGLMAVRRSHITLKDDYLEINTGRFADTVNYIKYSNIEVVRLVSTPFSASSGRVRLSISTNGTFFTARSLKTEDAGEIYEYLLYRCEQNMHADKDQNRF